MSTVILHIYIYTNFLAFQGPVKTKICNGNASKLPRAKFKKPKMNLPLNTTSTSIWRTENCYEKKKKHIPSVQQRTNPIMHLPRGANAFWDSSGALAIQGSTAILAQLCIQLLGELQTAGVVFTSASHDFQRCFIYYVNVKNYHCLKRTYTKSKTVSELLAWISHDTLSQICRLNDTSPYPRHCVHVVVK